MQLLHSLLAVAVAAFASWTLAVHLCVAFAWPVPASLVPFAISMIALHFVVRPDWSTALREDRRAGELSWLAALSVPALGFAFASLVLDLPTADDFNFFHRALAQLDALGGPFLVGDTAFNEPGLAAISPLHALTTWEVGVAMAAELIGLDPLGAYHNGTVVALHVLLVAVYAVWLRELGLGRVGALAGVVALLAFLLIDDPRLRSFGLAYRTLWVGKSAQWAVLFPMLSLFVLRYAREPGWGRAALVGCACSAAIGLSGTGVFLAPGLVGCAALAAFWARGFDRAALVPLAALPLAALHPLVVGGLLLMGMLEQPGDLEAWREGFPVVWDENLAIAFGSTRGIIRSAVLALLVPALVLRGSERRYVVGLSVVLLLFFVNPWMGPFWIDVVQPGSYWRVFFLFPIPLGAALAVGSVVEVLADCGASEPVRADRVRTAGAAVVAAALSVGWVAWAPAPDERRMPLPLGTKDPLDWRLPRAAAGFAHDARPYLEGRSLLAGPPVSWVAPLVVRGLRVEAARRKDTLHVFSNVGRAEEGRRRLGAWEWARTCEGFPPGANAASLSLAGSVDALAFPVCPTGAVGERELRAVLAAAPGRWREVLRSHGHRLWLRDAAAEPGTP